LYCLEVGEQTTVVSTATIPSVASTLQIFPLDFHYLRAASLPLGVSHETSTAIARLVHLFLNQLAKPCEVNGAPWSAINK
jgi:hypothetical protein